MRSTRSSPDTTSTPTRAPPAASSCARTQRTRCWCGAAGHTRDARTTKRAANWRARLWSTLFRRDHSHLSTGLTTPSGSLQIKRCPSRRQPLINARARATSLQLRVTSQVLFMTSNCNDKLINVEERSIEQRERRRHRAPEEESAGGARSRSAATSRKSQAMATGTRPSCSTSSSPAASSPAPLAAATDAQQLVLLHTYEYEQISSAQTSSKNEPRLATEEKRREEKKSKQSVQGINNIPTGRAQSKKELRTSRCHYKEHDTPLERRGEDRRGGTGENACLPLRLVESSH